jgi:hypothetical protein
VGPPRNVLWLINILQPKRSFNFAPLQNFQEIITNRFVEDTRRVQDKANGVTQEHFYGREILKFKNSE